MRLIEWAIVGALIFLPFATVNRIEVETQRKALLSELRYNTALDAAVDDAARMLTVNANQQRETQYESAKRVALNKDEAIAAFIGRCTQASALPTIPLRKAYSIGISRLLR